MMGKPAHGLVPILIALAITTAPSATADEPSNDEVRQDNQIKSLAMAAGVVVDAEIEELAGRAVAARLLEEQILATPIEHRSRSESRRLSERWARQLLEAELDLEIEALRVQLNAEHGREVLGPEWPDHAKERRRGALEAARNRAMSEFPQAFDSARKAAVDRQWNGATRDTLEQLYPTPEEVDAVRGRRLGASVLQRRLAERLQRRGDGSPEWTLLEENDRRLDELVERRIRAGLGLLDLQTKLLAGPGHRGAVASTIEAGLRSELRELVEAQVDGPRYGVFPSIQEAIPERAEKLVRERLTQRLAPARLCGLVTEARLSRSIRSQIALHEVPDSSRELLLRELSSAVADEAILEHLRDHGEPTDLALQLQALLAPDEELYRHYVASLEVCLDQRLPSVRRSIASQQLASLLDDRKTALDEAEILWFRDRAGDVTADAMYAELDWAAAVAEVPLLRESRERLEDRVRVLFAAGARALGGQLSLVDRNREWMKKARADRQSRESILAEAGRRVEEQWRRLRVGGGPLTSDGDRFRGRSESVDYLALFERTKQHIVDLVDDVFRQTPTHPPRRREPGPELEPEPRDTTRQRAPTREPLEPNREPHEPKRRQQDERQPRTPSEPAERDPELPEASERLLDAMAALERTVGRLAGELSVEQTNRILELLREVGAVLDGKVAAVDARRAGGSTDARSDGRSGQSDARRGGTDGEGSAVARDGGGRGGFGADDDEGRNGTGDGRDATDDGDTDSSGVGDTDGGTAGSGGSGQEGSVESVDGGGSDGIGAEGGRAGGSSDEGRGGGEDGETGGDEGSGSDSFGREGGSRFQSDAAPREPSPSCRENLEEVKRQLLLYEMRYGPLPSSVHMDRAGLDAMPSCVRGSGGATRRTSAFTVSPRCGANCCVETSRSPAARYPSDARLAAHGSGTGRLEQALYERQGDVSGRLVHHSDRGSQSEFKRSWRTR